MTRRQLITTGLLALTLLAWLGALGLNTDSVALPPRTAEITVPDGVPVPVPPPDPDLPEWKEDPLRVERFSMRQLTPKRHLDAVSKIKNMTSASKRSEGTIAVGDWESSGAIGGFPARNGRVAGIQLWSGPQGDRVYLGACGGGLWWSPKSGPDWTDIGQNLPHPSVRAFAVHPTDPDKIVVATGDWRRYWGAGMFRTDDGGASWAKVSDDDTTAAAYFRVLHIPGTPQVMLAAGANRGEYGTGGGIFRSDDYGASWVRVLDQNATDLVIHPTSPFIAYACVTSGRRGIYWTTTGGVGWSFLAYPPAGADSTKFDRASIALCRDAPANLAVVVEKSGQLQGVYVSADNGATWANKTAGIEGIDDGQVFHAQAIAIDPSDPASIVVGATFLATTTDAGNSWKVKEAETQIPPGHADITQLLYDQVGQDARLWICNDGGIYRHNFTTKVTNSWNGGTTTGLQISQIEFIDVELSVRTFSMIDNGVIRNLGTGWQDMVGSDGQGVQISSHLNGDIWLAEGIFTNPTWRVYFAPGATSTETYTGNTLSQWSLFYERFSRKMYSADRAITASLLSTNIDDTGSWAWQNRATLASGLSSRHVFGSELTGTTLYPTYWGESAISVCEDSAGTWNCRTVIFNTTKQRIGGVYASRERRGEAWIGLEPIDVPPNNTMLKLLYTDDDWEDWTDLSDDLDMVGAVEAVVQSPFNPQLLFVGTDVGVFFSEDSGVSWSPFQSGLPIVRCTDLRYVVDPFSGAHTLYVGTYGRGLYQRKLVGEAIVYVDPTFTGSADGTYENPWLTLGTGYLFTPSGGTLGLRGNEYVVGSFLLENPMTIQSFDGTAEIK